MENLAVNIQLVYEEMAHIFHLLTERDDCLQMFFFRKEFTFDEFDSDDQVLTFDLNRTKRFPIKKTSDETIKTCCPL